MHGATIKITLLRLTNHFCRENNLVITVCFTEVTKSTSNGLSVSPLVVQLGEYWTEFSRASREIYVSSTCL